MEIGGGGDGVRCGGAMEGESAGRESCNCRAFGGGVKTYCSENFLESLRGLRLLY